MEEGKTLEPALAQEHETQKLVTHMFIDFFVPDIKTNKIMFLIFDY